MTQDNSIYGIGFNLTYNVHITHVSDHRTFWNHGYTAVMTHAESHGPAYHSKYDTIDKVSTLYAKKNGQLGMSVLAEISGVLAHADQTTALNSALTIGIVIVMVVITLGILMFLKRKAILLQ
jgi:hypothetical protein